MRSDPERKTGPVPEQEQEQEQEREREREAATIRTLRDAGCDEALIRRFLLLAEDEGPSECLCLLSGHRQRLLETIHEDQKRIDILDYLIYTIRKEEKEEKGGKGGMKQ